VFALSQILRVDRLCAVSAVRCKPSLMSPLCVPCAFQSAAAGGGGGGGGGGDAGGGGGGRQPGYPWDRTGCF